MDNQIIFNRTKIVATVGPASSSKEILEKLVLAGVDVFRLNFSHGTIADHQEVIDKVREINKELGTHISLLQDLQGPKIRTKDIEGGSVELQSGEKLVITTEEILGTKDRISTTYQPLPSDVEAGNTILIDDGKIELVVESSKGTEVITRIIHGGILRPRKGMNLPNTDVSSSALSEKDHADLEFGLKNRVDWVALSFVRTADDIRQIQDRIKQSGKSAKVIAKIEKPEAIRNLDEIIAVADGLMVARGDLGVETKMEDVPMVQKMIVSKCSEANKPVIIATQMMESMIENPRPTRAETNDIANAVLDGADALMLSAETAAGKFPVNSVKSMVKTITSVEDYPNIYNKFWALDPESKTFYNDHLVAMACRLSAETDAKAIVGMTQSGYTGFRLSGHRPKAHIYVFTNNRELLTSINLYWGVRAFFYEEMKGTDHTVSDIEAFLRERNIFQVGDVFITTASTPFHWKQRTNTVKLNIVK